MKLPTTSVLLLALRLPAISGFAADEKLPSADEIVSRYVAARGGYEKIQAIQSLIYRGVYSEGGETHPGAAMALMRPYYKLVGDPEHPSKEFAEGYDGSAWEFYADPGVVLRTVGAGCRGDAARPGHRRPARGVRRERSTLEVTGVEPIAGRPAYRLLLRMADGFEEEEFVDVVTFLHVASRKAAPVHAFGAAVRSETRFGDFRPVNGVLFSFSNREVEIATGRVMNEMAWTSITANRPLRPADFAPPTIERTPVQELMAHLYGERSDVQAVQWTYRDFRRAHPEADTDVALQSIGYQILKMGDAPAAIALLERNAADYPRSSGAAFGLGRGYQTAGRSAEAITAFEQALRLDPQNARARKALDGIQLQR